MAEFLSPAWLADLDAALRATGAVAAGSELVVEEVVQGAPGGDVVYHVVLGVSGSRAGAGPAEAPDITLVVDHATAVDLARGTTNAQRALAAGALRIRGRLGALVRAQDALATLGDAVAAARDATSFPSGERPGR